MRLAHLHLPGITPFNTVSQIQQILTLRNLAYKKAATSASTSASTVASPPDPTIITFTPNPVYTTGRRDLPPSNTSSPSDHHPSLELSLPPSLEPIRSLLDPHQKNQTPVAEYHPTLRGGQTTYHGPGQLVAYTILDLRRLGLSPRCHIRLLENTVIDLLAKYGVKGFTTEDPGVWVNDPRESATTGNKNADAKKITAVGVHLRRNISSFGVGLNVTQEPMWFFKQIVACGLEGKEATSLEGMGVDIKRSQKEGSGSDIMKEVGNVFVETFVNRLKKDFPVSVEEGGRDGREEVKGIYDIEAEDVFQLEESKQVR